LIDRRFDYFNLRESQPMADDKTTAAVSSAATAQNEQRTATIRYIDRPEIDEVFADSVTGLLYDGQTLRMEFAVTRFDEIKPNAPISGRRYPACRLALSPAAAIDLINRMQQVATALTQSGAAKPTPRPGTAS
jgi:hypothetical protein